MPDIVVNVTEQQVAVTDTSATTALVEVTEQTVAIEVGTSGPAGVGVPAGGTTGQILAKNTATDYDTGWIDNYTTDVRKWVKSDYNGTLAKGTVVYISGADGANALVMPAIATSDGTSATTIGLLAQPLAKNESGWVILSGSITGIDTSAAAAAGDPVWLSGTTAGGVVYGLANKPVAPNHLVYLGTVTRKQSNNGSIDVHVSNGWEIDELHNVKITSPSNGQVLSYDATQQLWINSSEAGDISGVTATSPLTGGGTGGNVTIGLDQSLLSVTASQISDGTTTFARLSAANAFTVGGHTITNATASDIPLLIKGAASQSVPIFAVQTSDTTNRLRVTSGGNVVANGFTANTDNTSALTGSTTITNSVVSASVLTLNGAPSQSAASLVINNGGSQTGNFIDAGGVFAVTVGGRVGVRTISSLSASLNVASATASNVGQIIYLAVSPTADALQIRNSASTIIGGLSANAQLFTGTTAPLYVGTGGATTAASGDGTTAVITTTSAHGLAIGDMITVAGITPSGYNGTYRVTAVTTNTVSYLNATTGAQTVAGTVAAAAQTSIVAQSAGTAGALIRVAASPVANAFEVQGSTGNTLVAIYGSGTSVFNNRVIIGGDASARLNVVSSSTTQVQAVIRGAASQTGNLLEIQDSTSAILSNFAADGYYETQKGIRFYTNSTRTSWSTIQNYAGALAFNSTLAVGNAGAGVNIAVLNAYPRNATDIGLLVKGFASQTGALTQWQDSGGTLLALVNSVGTFRTSGFLTAGSTSSQLGQLTSIASTASTVGAVIQGAASQTSDLLKLQASTGTDVLRVDPSGRVSILAGSADVMGTANATFAMNTHAAGAIGMVVRGVASQTGNLFVLQNSSANSLAFFTATGLLDLSAVSATAPNVVGGVVGDKIALYEDLTNAGYGFGIQNSRIVAYVNGVNDGFAVRAKTGSGQKSSGTDAVVAFGNGSLTQTLASASVVGTIIKGAASQTADLQRWQDSSAVNLLGVTSVGVLYRNNSSNETALFGGANPADITFKNTSAVNNSYNALAFFGSGSNIAGGLSMTYTDTVNAYAQFRVSTRSASGWNGNAFILYEGGGAFVSNNVTNRVTLTVRGAASQTANLTEWQDSTPTTKSLIDSTGAFKTSMSGNAFGLITGGSTWGGYVPVVEIRTTGATQSTLNLFAGTGNQFIRAYDGSGNARGAWANDGSVVVGQSNTKLGTLSVYTDAAATVGAVIRGAVSQTADLQQWQTWNGTAATTVAKVDSNGLMWSGQFTTLNTLAAIRETNSGGDLFLKKKTATPTNVGADQAVVYFRDGTNAGTLKLVVRAGAAGAETTILDNIPQ